MQKCHPIYPHQRKIFITNTILFSRLLWRWHVVDNYHHCVYTHCNDSIAQADIAEKNWIIIECLVEG